jgi:hypothetical protein
MKISDLWKSKINAAEEKKREGDQLRAEGEAMLQAEVARLEGEKVKLLRSIPPRATTKATTIPALIAAVREQWLAQNGAEAVHRLSGRVFQGPDANVLEVGEPAFPEGLELFLRCLAIALPSLATQACQTLLDAVPVEEGLPISARVARFAEIMAALAEIEEESSAGREARREGVRVRHEQWAADEALTAAARRFHPHTPLPEPERPE